MKKVLSLLIPMVLVAGALILPSFAWEASSWAGETIEEANAAGLIPEILAEEDLREDISRAEFAAVAVKLYESLSGEVAEPAGEDTFSDTSDIDVLKAYNLNIVSGVTQTEPAMFDPDSILTRETASVMLTNVYKALYWEGWNRSTAADYTDYVLDTAVLFPFEDDAQIASWARESVYFMYKNSIISGTSSDSLVFSPKNTATREQTIIMGKKTYDATEYIALAKMSGNSPAYRTFLEANEALNEADSLLMSMLLELSLNMQGLPLEMSAEGDLAIVMEDETDMQMMVDIAADFMGVEYTVDVFYKDGSMYMDMSGTKMKMSMPMDEMMSMADVNTDDYVIPDLTIVNESIVETEDGTEVSFIINGAEITAFANDIIMGSLEDIGDMGLEYYYSDFYIRANTDKDGTLKTIVVIFSIEFTIEDTTTEAICFMEINIDEVGGVTIDFPADLDEYEDLGSIFEEIEAIGV